MRVIGGSARGRTLKGPPRHRGPGPAPVRATSDLIRGVIFDMLDAMGASYDRVLDLYAGTGALGIEALSRGDGTADFVEAAAASVAVIKANLDVTGFRERARVHQSAADRTIGRLSGPYTLIVADAPYTDTSALAVIERAAEALSGPETVLVVEHLFRFEPPGTIGGMRLYRQRRHGDTVVSIYERKDAST